MAAIINTQPINGRELVLYGAGHDGRIAAERLDSLTPSFCVARDGEKLIYGENMELAGLRTDVLEQEKHFVIIAANVYHSEMQEFLINLGYSKDEDYLVWNLYEHESNDRPDTKADENRARNFI